MNGKAKGKALRVQGHHAEMEIYKPQKYVNGRHQQPICGLGIKTPIVQTVLKFIRCNT